MNIFEISDGTFANTVSLRGNPSGRGIRLMDWDPTLPQLKGGGEFAGSPYSVGRDLVFAAIENLNETLTVTIVGKSQIEVTRHARRLENLLEQARSYWTTKRQLTPIWVKQQICESDLPLYGTIVNFSWRKLSNPFRAPFLNDKAPYAYESIVIGLELRPWQAAVPGTGACKQTSSVVVWEYNARWDDVAGIAPAAIIRSLLQTVTGRIMAGETAQIWYSDDDGVTWNILTVLPIGQVWSLLQTVTGRIMAGEDGRILYSDNDGGVWAQLTAAPTNEVYDLLQITHGDHVNRILASDAGARIWYSDNDGGAWAVATAEPGQSIIKLLQLTHGDHTSRIFATSSNKLWYSDDGGDTWTQHGTNFGSTIFSLLQTASGRVLLGNRYAIWYSDDGGDVWARAVNDMQDYITALFQSDSSIVYAGDWTFIKASENDGITWATDQTGLTGSVNAFIQTTTGKILAGESFRMLYHGPVIAVNAGAAATCTDIVYAGNKQNLTNITDIYIDDGGVWSANLHPMVAFPVALLPAVPIVNDALYVGISTIEANTSLFFELVFDIATVITYVGSYSLTLEYWNGAWVAATLQDGTGSFSTTGVCSIHWTAPADIATRDISIDGGPAVTGWWLRFRVSALTGTMAPPFQQNRSIYAVNNSFVEVAAAEIVGDLPALAHFRLNNRSDRDGFNGNAPDLYANRILAGLRSYEGAAAFQAFLNISDVQAPFGVTITVGANTSFVADNDAPTGRQATYNPAGAEVMATRAAITFGPTIANSYFGSFRVSLRVQRTAGVYTDFLVRLQFVSGSGGVQETTLSKYVLSIQPFEVLDFGLVTLPVGQQLDASDDGDISAIRIQVSAASGTPNLIMYDVCLTPVDESFVDSYDNALEDDSEIGASDSTRKLWDADSVTSPRVPLHTTARVADTNLKTAQYTHSAVGSIILQADERQCWHFFAMQALLIGAHTGANNQAMLTDAAVNFLLCGVEPGMTVYNITDNSSATITAVTATTITGALAGGGDNDWDTNDVCYVICPHWVASPAICHSIQAFAAERFVIPRGDV